MLALLGLSPAFAFALCANAARSLLDWTMIATFIGERQRAAPDHLQARVGITGRMMVIGSIALGSAIVSVLSQFVRCARCTSAWASRSSCVALVFGPPLRRAVAAAERP